MTGPGPSGIRLPRGITQEQFMGTLPVGGVGPPGPSCTNSALVTFPFPLLSLNSKSTSPTSGRSRTVAAIPETLGLHVILLFFLVYSKGISLVENNEFAFCSLSLICSDFHVLHFVCLLLGLNGDQQSEKDK